MGKSVKSIADVVERQLCTGCGACSFVEPNRFRMGEALEHGRRPFLRQDAAAESGDGLKVCPGLSLRHDEKPVDAMLMDELWDGWGPVYGVWEGFAVDDEIRRSGSSGGAATALSLFCLEQQGMGRVIHTAANQEFACLNETVESNSREELMNATGSRYAPASPCDGLDRVVSAPDQSVFVGKPCDVAAVGKARTIRPDLDEKIGVTIAFFCAGVPSTRGNLELLRKMGVENPERITSLRYRGNGWPGNWVASYSGPNGEEKVVSLTYQESWGFLQKYRQWRCYICPDHTGEFADISVGDPWYRPIEPGEPGKSLIVARTAVGKKIIEAAAKAGYIELEREDSTLLPRSQPNLLSGRGAMWGRLLVLRLLGGVAPSFAGFKLFPFWMNNLSLFEKFRSFTGTAKRVFVKKLRHRIPVREWSPSRSGMEK